jgi:hypothetical protein
MTISSVTVIFLVLKPGGGGTNKAQFYLISLLEFYFLLFMFI